MSEHKNIYIYRSLMTLHKNEKKQQQQKKTNLDSVFQPFPDLQNFYCKVHNSPVYLLIFLSHHTTNYEKISNYNVIIRNIRDIV